MSYNTMWRRPNDLWLRIEQLLPPPKPTGTPGRQERQRAM